MHSESREIDGLSVDVTKVVHFEAGDKLPANRPHAFVYFITVHNHSDKTVTLLGRKWVVHEADAGSVVIEGDGIVGKTPRLEPGSNFSYNSFHTTSGNARAEGSFHGVDETGGRMHVRIPPFDLIVPPAEAG